MPGETTKRVFDVTVAAILLVALSPLLGACALAVRVLDGYPVLFRHERVGRNGRRLLLVKLRTMRSVAGPQITVAGDPRVTALGRVLRRLKLDELPQLWNVLRGDMSIVGPRPEVPEYVALYPHWFRAVLRVRPGITDWASLTFSDEERLLAASAMRQGFYEKVLLPRKIALSRLYLRRRSLGLDIRLMVATVCVTLGLPGVAAGLAGVGVARRALQGLDGR